MRGDTVIRGAVYPIDLGVPRGHEQRGRRYGLVVSMSADNWSGATVIPTSTGAMATTFRPELEVAGQPTRFLCDQIRSIDTDYILGDPVGFLSRDEMAEVEFALSRYLGLVPSPDDYPRG